MSEQKGYRDDSIDNRTIATVAVRLQQCAVSGTQITLSAKECRIILGAMHKLSITAKAAIEKRDDTEVIAVPKAVQQSWRQPNKRTLKTVKHDIHCRYCNRDVTVYTLNSKIPPCCVDCRDRHKRAKAKERKERFNSKKGTL